MAQVDVLGGQKASGRWKVMGGHGGKTQLAIGLSGQGPALRVILEPQDRRAQNASVAQIVTHPRLDDSEVLADHQRTRPMGLEHEDADQRLMVIADVRALTGNVAVRNPPQPEEPDHMVDPDATGMTQGRTKHVPVWRIAELLEPVRPPGWLAPVLAELVVLVRRGTDGDPAHEGVGQSPGVRPLGVDADREVVNDPQRHTGFLGLTLDCAKLLVDDPLQPAVELDVVGDLVAQRLDGWAAGVMQLGGPLAPGQSVLLGQRAPRGEVEQSLALALAEGRERPLAP